MTLNRRPRSSLLAGRSRGRAAALGLLVVIGIASTPVSAVGARPTVKVPASIDATCSHNVASALNRWIRSVPAGRTLVFRRGSCYLLAGSHGIDLTGRSRLTLKGNGTLLRQRTDGASNFAAAFFLQHSDDIVIRGFRVDGGNDATATTRAEDAIDEHLSGAVIRAGSDRVRFTNMRWDRIRGFGVFISDDGGFGDWPTGITVRDSLIRGGEMGVAITAGRDITLKHNRIVDTVYIAVDLEPDRPHHGFEDVHVVGNTIVRFGWGPRLTSWFVAANPADEVVDDVPMNGLRIIGNRVERGPARGDNGNADGLGGLGIRADKSNPKRNVVIKNNISLDSDTQSRGRSVMYLANVHGLTVTGNRQVISGGAILLSDEGTTGERIVGGNITRS